uniref:Uncharacterized protein n=1 Tax=Marseillevirus LCMAC202 TaxID=2506606 RepID=A0A481YYI3_9VIRU|nr:MAG: hypothetical protein LCMAC202_03420 [Marseillevirus LCMAC202]
MTYLQLFSITNIYFEMLICSIVFCGNRHNCYLAKRSKEPSEKSKKLISGAAAHQKAAFLLNPKHESN